MKNLSGSLVKTSGKTATPSAWLLLLDFAVDGNHVRLVDNAVDVVFAGNTYTAANLSIGTAVESSDGQLMSWALSINDTSRLLVGTLETYDGAIGATVTLIVVNSKLLAESYAELTRTFVVQATSTIGDQITLQLSGGNLLLTRCPRYRYMALHCNWIFKTVECGYSGGLTTCDRTWVQCLARSNTPRFGGYLPLRSGTIRYAR